jgi:hypothetical protein
MQILYEIKEFNPNTGSLLVRYYDSSNIYSLIYNVDLPLLDGNLPNQSEIDEYINSMKPVGQLERMRALNTIQIPSFLQNLIPTQSNTPSGTVGDTSDPSPMV